MLPVLLALSCSSCSWFSQKPTVTVAKEYAKTAPIRVAVLPMVCEEGVGNEETASTIRRIFYNQFAALAYQDVELFQVDHVLGELKRADGAEAPPVPIRKLADALNCDAVIRGTVTRCGRIYAAVYSQYAVGLRVVMVDVRSGKELVQISHSRVSRTGGVPLDPLGVAVQAGHSAWHLREKTFLITANDLCSDIVKSLPQPDTKDLLRPPKVTDVEVTPVGRSVQAGQTISVAAMSAPRCTVWFRIRGLEGRHPMKEQSPGKYVGQYTVRKGDAVDRAEVLVRVTRYEVSTEHIFERGMVRIDAVPPASPPAPTVSQEAIEGSLAVAVNWPAAADGDVTAWRVFRSANGGAREQIAEASGLRYVDRSVKLGQTYEYAVAAIDAAGNVSSPSKPTRFVPAKPGPTRVAGALTGQTHWHQGGSPYVLAEDVTVPEGATLRIAPGTRVVGTAGLAVKGAIIAAGTAASPVVFEARAGETWPGIRLDSAKAATMMHCRVSGARVAVHCRGGAARIEQVVFRSNASDLVCEGGAEPVVDGCTFSGTAIAVRSEDSLPVLRANVFEKGTRIVVAGTKKLMLDGNYWGQLEASAVADRVRGPHDLTILLDAPPPRGRATALSVLQAYEAAMAAETPAAKMAALRSVLQADNGFLPGYAACVRLLTEAGKKDRAVKFAQVAAKLNPDRPEAHKLLGSARARAGLLREAAASLEQATSLRPDEEAVLAVLIKLYEALGDSRGAANAHRRYAELRPADAQTQANAARALRAAGDRAGALTALRRAVAAKPDSHAGRFLLAMVLLEDGQAEPAVAELRIAVKAQPDDPRYRRALASALERTDDAKGAEAEWRRSLALDSTSDIAKAVRAHLTEQYGKSP
jgi:tetratricopeptide (TPR) repeat protein